MYRHCITDGRHTRTLLLDKEMKAGYTLCVIDNIREFYRIHAKKEQNIERRCESCWRFYCDRCTRLT